MVARFSLLPALANAQQAGPDEIGRPPSHPSLFQVTPFLGMYVPVGSLVADSMVRLRPVGSLLVGGRLSLQAAPAFAVEASFGWSPNLVAQSDWRQTVDLEGGLWLASLRGRLRVNDGGRSDIIVLLSPGAGIVHRYGSAWRGMQGTTDAALVLGAGLRFHEPNSPFTFVFDLENFLSRTGYHDGFGAHYGGHVHHDFFWSLGVTLDVFGR
jgi:hypothetical protein